MSDVFEVGQKVRVNDVVDGEVTYGPFPSTYGTYTGYVVRLGDTERLQRESDLSAIPTPPAFAVGDEVTYAYGSVGGKLVAGPFTSEYHDDPIWVVEKPNGTHMTPTQSSLTKVEAPALKVGDRVRVTEDDPRNRAGEYVGKVGVLTADHSGDEYDNLPYTVQFGDGKGGHGAPNGRWCVKAVAPADENTYEHDGVAYDLTAKYRDREGDVWRFTGHRLEDVPTVTMYANDDNPDTIEWLARVYGPLVRVAD